MFVPLVEDDGWKLDASNARRHYARAGSKGDYHRSPSNPTGAVFGEQNWAHEIVLTLCHCRQKRISGI